MHAQQQNYCEHTGASHTIMERALGCHTYGRVSMQGGLFVTSRTLYREVAVIPVSQLCGILRARAVKNEVP